MKPIHIPWAENKPCETCGQPHNNLLFVISREGITARYKQSTLPAWLAPLQPCLEETSLTINFLFQLNHFKPLSVRLRAVHPIVNAMIRQHEKDWIYHYDSIG